jgi:hypothetical protein
VLLLPRESLGEFQYLGILSEFGVKSPAEFRNTDAARSCYRRMLAAADAEKGASRVSCRTALTIEVTLRFNLLWSDLSCVSHPTRRGLWSPGRTFILD